jgi:hypothetical protein
MSSKLPKYKLKAKQRLALFSKVVRGVRKEFKSEGISDNYRDAQKFTSLYIYGNFKGQPASKVKVDDIRNYTKYVLEELKQVPPPIDFADPRMIGEQEVTGINWFDLDDFLSTEIRSLYALSGGKDLRFEIIGGEYGRTGELVLSEYEYVSSGVRDIVESVRNSSPYVSSGEQYPYWEGYYGLRQGKKDDGEVDSYVLQIILVEGGQPVVEPQSLETIPPQEVVSEEEYKKRLTEVQKRLKDEQEKQRQRKLAEKMRKRKTAPRPTKKVKVKEMPKTEEKVDKTTRGKQVIQLNELKLKELELLRKDFDDKIISKAEYKRERDRVMRNYEDALKKLKRGGVV